MRRFLAPEDGKRSSSHWISLPALCCQAAGGDPAQAIPVAAAWALFYRAADLMDSVEDRERLFDQGEELGSGKTLSIATGMYFSASLALNRLEDSLGKPVTARKIRQEMLYRFLEMSGGQHLDLTICYPSLGQYWRIAQAKSGVFFSLACWAGAYLATRRRRVLQGFQQFGMGLGLLIQVLDDLKDYHELSQNENHGQYPGLARSFPAVFVLEVSSEQDRNKFKSLLDEAQTNPGANAEIITMIEAYGGELYLHTQLDVLRKMAIDGLDQTHAILPAREGLIALLDELHTYS